MAKITRKEKINKQMGYEISQNNRTNSISIKKIFTKNLPFLLILVLICIGVYFNSLDNELTLVDDIQGITFNENIKDIGYGFRTFNLQEIVYSISYHFFGFNPFPLRIVSVSLHTATTVLVFLFVYLLFDKKTAIMAALVFAIHPINTEAVTWVSGSPYLYSGLFNMLIFIFYVLYKKYGDNKKYLFMSLAVFVFTILFLRSPWVLVSPLALIIIDQFFFEDKLNFKKLWWIFLFAIPVSLYLATTFGRGYAYRMDLRSDGKNRVTLNTQAFKPVIEGYPYTIYLMTTLYLFPKNLSVYYDGMPVTTSLYVSMYLSFITYASLIFYVWKRNRRLTGILLILPVLISPVFSPIKITWFLAERYLYTGIAFFGILVALFFKFLEKKINNKYFTYGIFILMLILYSVRTILRNNDWQDTETLSYATMKSSPLSVRPYNDLGGHYYYEGDIDKAVASYEKGLLVVPTSGTGINNLGFIYIEHGPLIFRGDFVKPEQDFELSQKYFAYAKSLASNNGDLKTVSYFLNKALAYNIESAELTNSIADLYMGLKYPKYAKQLLERSLLLSPDNPETLKMLLSLDKVKIN